MRIVLYLAAILAGLALGLGSAYVAIAQGAALQQRSFQGWSYNALAGAEAADPYTRAMIARAGLLALRAEETIYFTLSADEDGRPLREGCVYELRGGPLPARWWSVTIYAPDHYLPRNNDHAFSIDATRAVRDGAGGWRARLSATRGDAVTWISTREARNGFTLTLRLYQPMQEAREAPARISFPRLSTLSCPDASA